MTFLPIVEREMRVAARRPQTQWFRLLAAVAAIGLAFVIFAAHQGPASTGQLSKLIFMALSVLAFGFSLLAGVFLTADCICSERREGTLELLFLTDLSSFDVVLGKWAAASFTGLYGLLAILPSLALPLLLGGVTPAECGRTALGIVNAILFSLAAGMFISTVSRDQTKAILGSAILILAISGLVPGLAAVASTSLFSRPVTQIPTVALASPLYTGYLALDAVYNVGRGSYNYWLSLGIVHAASWLFMGATLLLTPQVWRESPDEKPTTRRWFWRFGYTAGWRRAFKRRLDINPVFALAARLRWPHFVFWGLVTLVAINVLWLTFGYRGNPGDKQFHRDFSTALVFTNRVWITAMACRFLLELRRTGGLELMLTTPVPVRTLLRGHWRALRRLFLWPVLAIAALHVFYVCMCGQAGRSSFQGGQLSVSSSAMVAGQSLLKFLTDILALCWVGAWLSISSRKANLAILKTYALVILLPWAFAYFSEDFTTFLRQRLATYTAGRPALQQILFNPNVSLILLPSACWVLKNCLFVLWASLHLRRHFRQAAAQTYVQHSWRPRWWRKPGSDSSPRAPLLPGRAAKALVL